MPRIQILPLPEGASDERPPFALVIDQADETILQSLAYGIAYDSDSGGRPLRDALKDELGARGILCFTETIEIPANDVTAYATPTAIVHVEGDTTGLAERVEETLTKIIARTRQEQEGHK
ncbi:hypothetical protein [Streptomyces sp. NPDC007110]|uniref:hypothetical protein n=1 Tax=Streptomyces sp. NPDC007110 TaxID=3156916 RepID=UPI0033D7A242